jgi:hypothetical protein
MVRKIPSLGIAPCKAYTNGINVLQLNLESVIISLLRKTLSTPIRISNFALKNE